MLNSASYVLNDAAYGDGTLERVVLRRLDCGNTVSRKKKKILHTVRATKATTKYRITNTSYRNLRTQYASVFVGRLRVAAA